MSRVATSTINVQRYSMAPFIQIVPWQQGNDPQRWAVRRHVGGHVWDAARYSSKFGIGEINTNWECAKQTLPTIWHMRYSPICKHIQTYTRQQTDNRKWGLLLTNHLDFHARPLCQNLMGPLEFCASRVTPPSKVTDTQPHFPTTDPSRFG